MTDNLLEYCSPSAEISVSKRFGYCPLCKRAVSRDAFVVTRTAQGYAMYCHRCGGSRFVRNTTGKLYTPPKSVVIKRIKNIITPNHLNKQQEYVYLPKDTVNTIPIKPLLWLRSYNVTDEEILQYHIGWSEVYKRLILPVYKDNELIYWQGRYFGDNPAESKYLNISSSREDVMFLTEDYEHVTQVLVIVEDIISAIAIQRTGCRALALLGSNLPAYVVTYLAQQASLYEDLQVVVWLDSDKKKQSVEFSKRLNTFDINSRWVSTTLDPKAYTTEELITYLNLEVCHED